MAVAAAQAAAKGSQRQLVPVLWDNLLAFREKRGPFGRTGASGKGDDDRDDERDGDDVMMMIVMGSRRRKPEADSIPGYPALPCRVRETLRADAQARRGGAACGHPFDLGITLERLQPDAAQATRWIEKLYPPC